MVEMGHNHTFCHDLHNHTDIEVRLVWRLMMTHSYNAMSSSSSSSSTSVTMPPFTDRGAEEGQHIRDVRRDHDAGNQKTQ